MAIYEYQCPKGHVSDLMVRMENRPQTVPCACGETATYIVSATPTTFRANDRKAFKRSGR